MRESPIQSQSKKLTSIGIIGGGSAGYMTAIALRRAFPDLKVHLIESSQIPIIGVGEASTPPLVDFLHKALGLDPLEFFQEVSPTLKLGIRFEWGLPHNYHFNYAFGRTQAPFAEAEVYDGHINSGQIESLLMEEKKILPLDIQKIPTMPSFYYAYHLENKRFVKYLKKKAEQVGVQYLDRKINDVILAADTGDINYLLTNENEKIKYDLYIDCSGFSSLLMEKALGSSFTSYNKTLFTDTALTAKLASPGVIKPYTTATTMDHGWCWNIPHREGDNIGYVFSSAHCDVEKARQEMLLRFPKATDFVSVPFRPGRHQHFWKNNVVAIGNAYGFVEPLESTGLHMCVFHIRHLIKELKENRRSPNPALNEMVGAHWDNLRWFLGIHFKFNKRLNTSFWQEARHDIDISGTKDLVERFHAHAPLEESITKETLFEDFFNCNIFGIRGYNILLLGQKEYKKIREPLMKKNKWEVHKKELMDYVKDYSIDQKMALDMATLK